MNSLGCNRAAAKKMPDNPAKYRTLTPTGRCCSRDWDVADSVESGSGVDTPFDFIPFDI